MRREAGQRLLQVAQRLQAAGVEPMSEDEIVAEVKAARPSGVRLRRRESTRSSPSSRDRTATACGGPLV